MDSLKLKFKQELNASINNETTPSFIKNKNMTSRLPLDNSIISHIKNALYEKSNNEVSDEIVNNADTDEINGVDQDPKVFHSNEMNPIIAGGPPKNALYKKLKNEVSDEIVINADANEINGVDQDLKVFHSNEMNPIMAEGPPNEILQKIFKHESQNIGFLHSCVLVNKSWSINAIQFLWNRPFNLLLLNYNKHYSHQIIATYRLCTENKATYNYHRYLRHLPFFSFLISIQKWSNLNDYVFALQLAKDFFSFFSSFTSLLDTLDFTIDVKNVEFVNLMSLMNSMVFKSMIFILIQNTNVLQWFSNVNEIILDGDAITDYDFFMLLQSCNNIKTVSNLLQKC
jgi:hypothetical protein